MRRRGSIRLRFTGWYLAVLALLLVAMSVGTYLYLSHALYENLDEALTRRAAELARQGDLPRLLSDGVFVPSLGEYLAFILPTEGGNEVVSSRPALSDSLDPSWIEAASNGTPVYATLAEGEQPIRVLIAMYRPVAPQGADIGLSAPGGRPAYLPAPANGPAVLVVGKPMDVITSSLGALRGTLLLAVPLTLLLSAGGGLFLVRRALRPVDRMIELARSIQETDLGRRVDIRSNDELGRLGATLNGMLARLDGAFRRQRQFADDASHELRSPLSVIEAEATLALRRDRPPEEYRRALETIASESAAMSRLVDQLLALARGDASAVEISQPIHVDFGALVSETVAVLQPIAEEKGLAVEVSVSPAIVRGDPAGLRRLVINLVENAVRYTEAGGTIVVGVVAEAREVVLRVEDSGIGIAPEDRERIFERFFRADAARRRSSPEEGARGGSGLGLAICRQIVELHGGSLAAESTIGRGSTFIVRLPQAGTT